jgi:hypothetical protein
VAGEEEAKRLRRHLQESIRRARSPEYQPKVRRLDDEHFLVITWDAKTRQETARRKARRGNGRTNKTKNNDKPSFLKKEQRSFIIMFC